MTDRGQKVSIFLPSLDILSQEKTETHKLCVNPEILNKIVQK